MSAADLRPTLDWRSYVDVDAHAHEVERCFQRAWHYVGHSSGLGAVGDQRATTALDVPVLLVREDEDTLRAFVNACRHRGARLVEDSACAKAIQCPYHGWTYGLDGALRAAPLLQPESGHSPADLASTHSLHELRLESWGPLLFVALDEAAPPLLEWLGPIPDRVAGLGIDVEQLDVRHHSAGESACNWKVACENYLECYHCRIAHRGFCDVVDVRSGAYDLQVDGNVAIQVAPRRQDVGDGGELFDGRGPVEQGEFYFVFPSLVAYVPPGEPVLALGPVVPRSVDRTWRSLDYLAPERVDATYLERLVEWDDQVGREDQALVEAVQAGMAASRIIDHGSLLPGSERLVDWFAGQVRERI